MKLFINIFNIEVLGGPDENWMPGPNPNGKVSFVRSKGRNNWFSTTDTYLNKEILGNDYEWANPKFQCNEVKY